ncbi:MAG: NADPH-dependent FMN reductase, partial [Stenotrophomonas sp.]|nr:NADPH-dependent FMN reductase [Stenotrophomonas sp.]
MPVRGQPEAFLHFKEGLIDEAGSISNAGTQEFLQGFVDRFLTLVAVHGKGA